MWCLNWLPEMKPLRAGLLTANLSCQTIQVCIGSSCSKLARASLGPPLGYQRPYSPFFCSSSFSLLPHPPSTPSSPPFSSPLSLPFSSSSHLPPTLLSSPLSSYSSPGSSPPACPSPPGKEGGEETEAMKGEEEERRRSGERKGGEREGVEGREGGGG